ncbi:polysaccharide pyruvyl transferase family protein [soil metagenome]
MDRRDFLGTTMASVTASITASVPASARHRKAPRILLVSGWQTINIGDIGHTPGMLRLLERHLPQAEVVLWPRNIGDGVKEMLVKHFPKVTSAMTAAEVTQAFADCDFLLHSSGPALVGGKQLAEWSAKTKKPYGILGITVGTMDDASRAVLNGAKFFYTRDTLSLAYAKKEKITTPILDFAPDSAFAVDIRDDAKADAFRAKHGLEEGKFLCVIPKYRNTPYWLVRKPVSDKPLTDGDKAKDKTNQAMKESDFAKVRPAVIEFLKTTPYKVVLVPEDKTHININKEMFLDRIPDDLKSRVVWKDDYWLTDEAISLYLKSLGLLSMDMHSPIMCIGNGIPAIHCRFKEQTTKGQMWNDIGLNNWLFNLDDEKDGDKITAALLAMVKDPAAAKKTALKAKAFVDGKFAETFKVLGKSLA